MTIRLPLILVALVLAGLAVVNAAQVAGGITAAQTGPDDPVAAFEYTQVFLPRLAMALLAGAGLGFAGAVFQGVLANPLASPSTLGVSSGAHLALTLALLAAPALYADHPFLIATAGAFAAWGIIAAVNRRRMDDPVSLIICGMILAFTFGAITTCLMLWQSQSLQSLFLWGAGDLTQQGWDGVLFLLPRLGFGAGVVLLLIRAMDTLTLGSDTARAIGLPVARIRLMLLSGAILLSASVTAAVGIVAFIGLAAPHLARLSGARRSLSGLLLSTLIGAMLLALMDQILQMPLPFSTARLPTGALAGVLGAPLLLLLLNRLPARSEAPVTTLPIPLRTMRTQTRIVMVLILLTGGALVWAVLVPWTDLVLALDWRAPRVAAASLAGLALGVAGCLVQRLLGNPMASPEIIGVSTGAAIGMIGAILYAPVASETVRMVGAMAGAGAAMAVMLMATRCGRDEPRRLILIGIVITAFIDAMVLIVLASGNPNTGMVLSLLSGSTYRILPETLVLPALLIFAGIAMSVPAVRWLAILPLGRTVGHAIGLSMGMARACVLVAAVCLTCGACLLIGPVSFVGLAAPHIARALGLRHAVTEMAGAGLAGAVLVTVADQAGRVLLRPYELPAGLVSVLVIAVAVAVWAGSRRVSRGLFSRTKPVGTA